ncbi:hypothetical protein SNEBB_004872 [Seison nebaliae]|nr:hypothetical protein SNEBB_004872 [Seison nebaliae]
MNTSIESEQQDCMDVDERLNSELDVSGMHRSSHNEAGQEIDHQVLQHKSPNTGNNRMRRENSSPPHCGSFFQPSVAPPSWEEFRQIQETCRLLQQEVVMLKERVILLEKPRIANSESAGMGIIKNTTMRKSVVALNNSSDEPSCKFLENSGNVETVIEKNNESKESYAGTLRNLNQKKPRKSKNSTTNKKEIRNVAKKRHSPLECTGELTEELKAVVKNKELATRRMFQSIEHLKNDVRNARINLRFCNDSAKQLELRKEKKKFRRAVRSLIHTNNEKKLNSITMYHDTRKFWSTLRAARKATSVKIDIGAFRSHFQSMMYESDVVAESNAFTTNNHCVPISIEELTSAIALIDNRKAHG